MHTTIVHAPQWHVQGSKAGAPAHMCKLMMACHTKPTQDAITHGGLPQPGRCSHKQRTPQSADAVVCASSARGHAASTMCRDVFCTRSLRQLGYASWHR